MKNDFTKIILGKKIGMTQIFQADRVVPVTVLEVGPCRVLQIRTKEKDAYEAIQVGYEALDAKRAKKSLKDKTFRYIRELKFGKTAAPAYQVGDVIDAAQFAEGAKVTVSGISKGKGFQGGVKRWGFHGRNATHGVKHEERTVGSTGGRFPQHVVKGRHMPGRLGGARVTTHRMNIMRVDAANNMIVVKGAIPGARGTLVEIRGS